MNTGANQPATVEAVPPANPSRANTPAAVQLGIAAATPMSAPAKLVDLFVVGASVFPKAFYRESAVSNAVTRMRRGLTSFWSLGSSLGQRPIQPSIWPVTLTI